LRQQIAHSAPVLGDKSGGSLGILRVNLFFRGALEMTQAVTAAPVTDWPLYWFARLERAVEAGDHQAAAQADRELRRLGVRVQYGRPAKEVATNAG
jgi:hypothetical protein